MPEHLRALVVILFLATFTFLYARKAFAAEIQPDEFKRWRNAWYAITLIAFLAHNFWLFLAASALVILYLTKVEPHKFVLYVLLFSIIPPIYERIPGLFDITYVRMLSLLLLLPVLLRKNPEVPPFGRLLTDQLILGFALLNMLLMMRGTTFTDAIRYGIYGFTEFFLPYYAASRLITNFAQMKKILMAFVLVSMIAATVAAFEFIQSWLLYSQLGDALRVDWNMGLYLGRGDSVRAMASLGHSLILGVMLMTAFGFYLFVSRLVENRLLRLAGFGLIAAGLIASLSRGPWVGTAILFLVFIAYGPKLVQRFAMLAIAAIIAIQVLPSIPGGNKVIDLLPFVGETDKENVEYRQKLIDKSLVIIQRYPLFGVYDARQEPEMEDMVQGEGIIDIVNSYLGIALANGLVGLGLFLGFFMRVLWMLRKSLKRIRDKSSMEHLCGRSLMAAMVAILVTIFTVSSIGIIPTIYWSLAGLIVSYSRIMMAARATATSTLRVEYPVTRLKKIG